MAKAKPSAAPKKLKPPAPPGDNDASIRHTPSSRFGPWIILLVIVLFASAMRLRLADMPLERDEGEYAYAGQLMLQGIPPYDLACNMKLPGTYASYALLMAVFGQTAFGIHVGVLFVNAANILLVFLLGRRLFDAPVGLAAAVSYSVMANGMYLLAMAGHATHFVILFAMIGLLLLLRGLERGQTLMFFLSGLALGLAYLMKQPGACFLGLAVLYLGWHAIANRPIAWSRTALRLGLVVVGGVIPFGLLCLFLWHAGVFPKFWFWTVDYARQYATIIPPSQGIPYFFDVILDRIGPGKGLWALGGVGLAACLGSLAGLKFPTADWARRARSATVFLVGFLLLALVGTASGFFWREHYFILMLPAMSILAGAAVSAGREGLKRLGLPAPLAAAVVVLVLLGSAAYVVAADRVDLFERTPEQACRLRYGGNPFVEVEWVADHIRDRTTPDDTIAVLGSEPEIYFDARRHSCTGYIYTYGMMEPQTFARQMQDEMIHDLSTARPKFIVMTQIITSWLPRRDSDTTIFQWANQYLSANYVCVGVADIWSLEHTEYTWDDSGVKAGPRSNFNLTVFRRIPGR